MRKILVIDDDPDIVTIIQVLLKRQGYKIAAAVNETDAYREVEAFAPDLILLDVLLSGADGRAICRRLKESEAFQNIPVIIFSAHPGAQKHIEDYKADDFIVKPFRIPDLLQKIEQHLKTEKSS